MSYVCLLSVVTLLGFVVCSFFFSKLSPQEVQSPQQLLFLNRKCIADILERFHIGDFVLLICKYYEVRSGVFKNQYWH